MIRMAFYRFFFVTNIGVGGGKSLILFFYIHLFSLHFPELEHDSNDVREPVLYTSDLSGTELLQTHRTSPSRFYVYGV